jgi:hypothetical protein
MAQTLEDVTINGEKKNWKKHLFKRKTKGVPLIPSLIFLYCVDVAIYGV